MLVKPPKKFINPLVPSSSDEIDADDIPPPPLDADEGYIYKVNIILVSRWGNHLEYLVDWEGYGTEERLWDAHGDILDPSFLTGFHTNHPNHSAPRGRAIHIISHCGHLSGWGAGYYQKVSLILSTRPLCSTHSFRVTRILISNTCTIGLGIQAVAPHSTIVWTCCSKDTYPIPTWYTNLLQFCLSSFSVFSHPVAPASTCKENYCYSLQSVCYCLRNSVTHQLALLVSFTYLTKKQPL